MSGTSSGALKAVANNKANQGGYFYIRIGRKGGKAPHKTPRGFAANRERASVAGRKGGSVSRRRRGVLDE